MPTETREPDVSSTSAPGVDVHPSGTSGARPPAIEPELAPALAAFVSTLPESDGALTFEALQGIRAMLASVPRPPAHELGREGVFLVEEEAASGENHAPPVPV